MYIYIYMVYIELYRHAIEVDASEHLASFIARKMSFDPFLRGRMADGRNLEILQVLNLNPLSSFLSESRKSSKWWLRKLIDTPLPTAVNPIINHHQ